MIDPALSAKIDEWRRKCADGSITVEELQQAIITMRGARKSAASAASTSGTRKSSKSTKSVDQMLGELDKL